MPTSKASSSIKLELLSPARDAEIARLAILHGADAVYIGGPSHGARAAAGNSIDSIASLVDFAHGYGARVYATLNTIIYDSELIAAERLAKEYWRIGVDALIVQDMGLLCLDLPPIDLHASTQCDIRTPQKAQFLAKCGFSQLVLPREFSLDEIRAVRAAVPDYVALEAFVHGALCVSYSGDCQASFVANGRSANRGECSQMCRMAYDLVDANGNLIMGADGKPVAAAKHLLSLRDLNRLPDLPALVETGITSFKIEGRLKDAAYVKNVTAAYRAVLDRIIDNSGSKYTRSSWGKSEISFSPSVDKAFNRGFTSYFLTGRQPDGLKMANLDTPKQVGHKVGVIEKSTIGKNGSQVLTARLSAELHNGDGLVFFNKSGQLQGFRLNRIDGNRLFPASPVSIQPGQPIYRNSDAQEQALMARNDTATRLIDVEMKLRMPQNGLIALFICVPETGALVEATADCDITEARTPQTQVRERNLSKLGDTRFRLTNLIDEIPDNIFVPASSLATIRRDAIALLDHTLKATYPYRYRRSEDFSAVFPADAPLTYHDNVANAKAEEFYRSHGATIDSYALEAKGLQAPQPPKGGAAVVSPDGHSPFKGLGGSAVMTTRYCLRRELGCCLREKGATQLPEPLYIRNKAATFRLAFDCSACRMHLLTNP